MATTPPYGESEEPAQRWTGRASVSTPEPAAPIVPASRGVRPPPAPPGPPPVPTYGSPKGKRKPRWGRIALVSVLVLALVAGGVVVAGYLWAKSVDDGVKRTGSLDEMVQGDRPVKTIDGAVNILLLGSDSRDPDQDTDEAGNWRTDTIVLMHIPATHDKAYFISFPRDLWVHVPKSKDGQYGDQMAKINAATAWGGVPLMVQTVEEYTGVRIDHLALIDFGGFVKVVDALGGVDMRVEKTIRSIHPPYRVFTKGMNHFTGAEALDYVRQRKQFSDGDFARMRHQQEFLKAIVDKAGSSDTVTSLGKLTSFVSSVADAVTVDKDFSLIDTAWQFHSLRGTDLTFMTSPHKGTGTIDGQSVVLGDKEKALSLFDAVTKDTVGDWIAQNGKN